MTKVRRIFDVAKELNISHIEIIDFLNKKGIKVTLMSPVTNEQYTDVLENFQQEKNQVDRLRKEKARLNVVHHNQDKELIDEQQAVNNVDGKVEEPEKELENLKSNDESDKKIDTDKEEKLELKTDSKKDKKTDKADNKIQPISKLKEQKKQLNTAV